MINGRTLDNSSQVILWQNGVVGDRAFRRHGYDLSAMPLLLERLYRYYRPTHTVVIYEAATLPGCEPVIRPVPLHLLPYAGVSSASTLYIPRARPAAADASIVGRLKSPPQ